MGKLAPRPARPSSIPSLASKMNPIDKEKEKIARMKEAKAKYSQMSRNYVTARTGTKASSAPKLSAAATTGSTTNIPMVRKTSATTTNFRGSSTNLSRDEFVPCADSLDAIRNNRPTQMINGRASGFGFGRPSLMPRPSLLPFGINPFSDKCTADDKKIFNDYMKERLGPTSPMVPNSIGRPNLGISRVRFVSEDVIEERRESGGLVEEKKPTPIKEAKNEVRSILKSRLDTSKPSHTESMVEEKENKPVAEIACSSFKKIEETPMLRRSKRPPLLFAEPTDEPSGSKSPMVTRKARPSPIMSRVSDIDEEPAISTPSSVLKANNAASTLKCWIDFYQSWTAATDEEKAMFPEAMFTELCASFEAEKSRRNDKSDNGPRRSKRNATEKKKDFY